MSDVYKGILFTTKSCTCKEKDKSNWIRISKLSGNGMSCIVRCNKCLNQWSAYAKYVKDLPKAPWL